jgi:hypothetical protein
VANDVTSDKRPTANGNAALWTQLGRRVDHLEDTVGRLEQRIEAGFNASAAKMEAVLSALGEMKADAVARERNTRDAMTPAQTAQTAAAIVVVVVAVAGFAHWWLNTTVGKETEALARTDTRFAEIIGQNSRNIGETEKRIIRIEERLNGLLEAAGKRQHQDTDKPR